MDYFYRISLFSLSLSIFLSLSLTFSLYLSPYSILSVSIYVSLSLPDRPLEFPHSLIVYPELSFADSTMKPGPGAYSPENVLVNKSKLPSYSLGIRHSEYITPLIVEVD